MASSTGHTANREPASDAGAGGRLPDQPRMGPPNLRPKPVALRPATVTGSQESEKEIRKRLMQGIPKARRWVIKNRIELTLPPEFSQPPGSKQEESATVQTHEIEGVERLVTQSLESGLKVPPNLENTIGFPLVQRLPNVPTITHPRTILGAGRVDPFGNYPIQLSYDERHLLDQLYTGTEPVLRTFRNSWLPTALKDPATFHQFLANVSLNLYQTRGQPRSRTLSGEHHAVALRTVNSNLSDPTRNTDDAMIASVVTFVCYCVTQEDFVGFDAHIDGLANIIRLRGGMQTLDHNPTLRCMVFGVDLSGACRRDSRPTFPPPDRLIQAVQRAFRDKLKLSPNHAPNLSPRPWANAIPRDHLLTKGFDDLLRAINYTKIKTAHNEDWIEVKFIVFWIDPIVHNVLGQGPETQPSDGPSIVQETTRIGLILFLFKLRRVCGQLGVSTIFFIKKLKSLASTMAWKTLWNSSEPLLLWVLFVGMLEAWGTEDQEWYAETAAMAAHWMGMKSWDGALEAVKSFPWVDGLFEDECERCKPRFQGIMGNLEQDLYSP
ncbi:hypothetical protein ONS95_005069 [Cadophora gregata]|uniref:uncharacterized protein n=1 Tax=Cadophora gregata TaxID=51156 RepID=UPI0026DAA2C2|nr:uncharacterized protein ONS95_005069 [Cadophora gregata]KAK0104801.1 hypothetical protein ONS95_005069 [Cadophora gregata]